MACNTTLSPVRTNRGKFVLIMNFLLVTTNFSICPNCIVGVWAKAMNFHVVVDSGAVNLMTTLPVESVSSWGKKKAVSWKFCLISGVIVSDSSQESES